MVVVVATILAFAAMSLKSTQAENVRIEKMNDILRSIGEGKGAATAPDKAKYVTQEYDKFIVDSYAVNSKGDRVEGANAFNLLINLKAEYDKPEAERVLPVFVSKSNEGTIRSVLPVWGVGLWGPVWGYVALESDWNSIYGVVFDHKSETPGLGAEITMPEFTDQFKQKQIFDAGTLVAVSVLKGSGSSDGNIHAVDAISGGTITSRGVEKMLKDCLASYSAFLEKQKSESAQPAVSIDATLIEPAMSIDSLTIN